MDKFSAFVGTVLLTGLTMLIYVLPLITGFSEAATLYSVWQLCFILGIIFGVLWALLIAYWLGLGEKQK